MPILGGLLHPRSITGARRWIVGWCVLLVVMNVIARYLGMHHINTHPVAYAAIPFQGASILWAFSLWQVRPMARLTLRTAIPPFIIAYLLLLLVEDLYNFSAIAEPVYSLLALGAAAYTLLTRSSEAQEPLLRQDWFWICAGLAIHFGALATLLPLSAAYIYTNQELVIRAYEVRAAVNILAFAIITIGMLCPPSILSGPSSSPRSSV